MNSKLGQNAALKGGLLLLVLAAAWILPPAMHRTLGYCPVRADGVSEAQAVPGFARKYGVSCTACHSAWPTLNEHGRQFKMNGYRQERDETNGTKEVAGIKIPSTFPLSAVVKARPYDKRHSDLEFRMRALHELELFIADGGIGGDFSYFTEAEMEDEPDARVDNAGDELGAFTPVIGALQVGWHPREWGNVVAAHRNFFDMDPYQTLSLTGKLTTTSRLVTTQGETSGHSLSGEMQTTMAYGELSQEGLGSLYYAAGMTTDADDPEGAGGKDGNVRLAFDSMKGVMLGTFASKGTTGKVQRTPGPVRYDQSRMGVDLLVEAMGLTMRGAGVYFYDKAHGSNTRVNNRGGYVEAFYAIKSDGKPTIVPLLRQDYVTTVDGTRHNAVLTAQLAAYLKPNIKSFIEYSQTTSVFPRPAAGRDHRWILQLELGF